jgi:hypothetical protein
MAEPKSSSEARLRREVGLFRERFQALGVIQQELQGARSPQAILRSAQNVIASTVGADSAWVLDGRGPSPRLLVRSPDQPPAAMLAEVRHVMHSGRLISRGLDDAQALLIPLQSGPIRWGALAVRVPAGRSVDAEAMRFLSLAAGIIGGAGALWEARTPKGFDAGAVYQAWLSLSALPARCLALAGENGTGKRTLAERIHDRYVGGGFAGVQTAGGDDDEAIIQAALRRPGVRTLYVHDAVRCTPAGRALLFKALENNAALVVLLGTTEAVWPVYPDALLSRAALVTIRLPALRERAGEIPGLVQAGLAERGIKVKVSSAARQALVRHAWPGNYGELGAFIAHAEQALRLDGAAALTGQITRRLLGDRPWLSLERIVDALEGHVLGEALRRFDGNRTAAARALGMTPRQVGYKCTKYGLE